MYQFIQKLARISSPQLLAVCIGVTLLSACGGGGGSSSNESSTAAPAPVAAPSAPAAPADSQESADETDEDVDYTPDAAALNSEANKSTQLYVEPDFTFDTHKRLTLDISATGARGQVLSDTLVTVSVVDSDITALDDERLQNKALLMVAKTDGNGELYRQVEIASSQQKLRIELNALGIENEVLAAIANDNYVSYQFR